MVFLDGKRYGFEVKYSDAPVLTKSMKTAIQDLQLFKLFVVNPGKHTLTYSSKRSLTFSRLSLEPTNVTISFFLNLV